MAQAHKAFFVVAIFIYSDPHTFSILPEKKKGCPLSYTAEYSKSFLNSATAQPPVQRKQVI